MKQEIAHSNFGEFKGDVSIVALDEQTGKVTISRTSKSPDGKNSTGIKLALSPEEVHSIYHMYFYNQASQNVVCILEESVGDPAESEEWRNACKQMLDTPELLEYAVEYYYQTSYSEAPYWREEVVNAIVNIFDDEDIAH